MKSLRRIMALLIAMIMVVAMGTGAVLADEGDGDTEDSGYTITMSTTSGHTYTAYQIFAGDLSGSTLSNIVWGDDVDGDSLLDALKDDETYGSAFASITSFK